MLEIHVMNLISIIILAFSGGMVLEFLSPTQTKQMVEESERKGK